MIRAETLYCCVATAARSNTDVYAQYGVMMMT